MTKIIPLKRGRLWSLVGALVVVVALVGMSLGGQVQAQNDAATVSVIPEEQMVSRGAQFTVAIEIEDAVDLTGYSFDMMFDPTVVNVVDVEDGGFLGASIEVSPDTWSNTLGLLNFGALIVDPPYESGATGDGTLAIITLEAVGRGTSALNLMNVDLYNLDAELEEPNLVNDGTVTSLLAMEVVPAHPEQAVAIGEFTEEIVIKGAEDLAGYRFTLRTSDDSVVKLKDVELGPFLEDNSDLVANTNATIADDEITFDVAGTPPGADPVDGATGDGVIATVTLEAMAVGDAELTLHAMEAYDTTGAAEVPTALNGLVHVSDVTLSVVPDDVFAFVTQTFEVTIHVDDGAVDLSAYKFSLAWNPEVLAVTDVADTGFLGTGVSTNLTQDPDAGTLTFEAVQPEPPADRPDGPGDLATITFEAIGEGTSVLDLGPGLVYLDTLETPAVTLDGFVEAELCVEPMVDSLTATPDDPDVGEEVEFEAMVSGSRPITYTWDFGDGTATETGQSDDMMALMATHAYAAGGSYTALLEVENFCDTDSAEVTVEVPFTLFMPIIMNNYMP